MQRDQTFRIAVRKYPPFVQAIRAQWDDFEKTERTGFALDLVALDLHPLETALFADGGMARGDFDVAFVATDWIAAMFAEGAALDLAPMLEDDAPVDYPHGWASSLLGLQQIEGAVLGVPYHDGPECLIYRKDLFEDAVLQERYRVEFNDELAVPETWDAFHRVARFLQDRECGLFGTVFAAFPDGHNSVYDFLLQLWTRGGELIDSDGQVRFHSEEAVAALEFYRALLADESAVHPECLAFDSVKAGLAFAAGEVALMINWFGFATIAHCSPDSAVRGKVDVALLPHGEHGSTASLNVYWILSIAKGSPHTQVAWRFLWHVLTPAMDKVTTMSGAIGCRRSTWHDAEVAAMIPFCSRMDDLHGHAREIPQRVDWPEIAALIDRLVTRTVTSSRPVADLLREADEEFQGQSRGRVSYGKAD